MRKISDNYIEQDRVIQGEEEKARGLLKKQHKWINVTVYRYTYISNISKSSCIPTVILFVI